MKLKILHIILFALGINMSVSAQFNSYKYVIVPKKFDVFKSENMHLTSTMVKHYFSQYGFNAVYDDALQADLVADPCLGITAQLLDFSTLFATKTIIVLTDCEGKEVFRTMEGRSKEKEYRDAYKEALQNSFASFDGMNYKYVPKKKQEEAMENNKPITISFKDDVKSVGNEPNPKVIEQKATTEEQLYKSKEPISSNMVKVEESIDNAEEVIAMAQSMDNLSADGLLVAKTVDNGYHLLDASSNVVLQLQETSMEDIFLTNYQGNNAVVFKKDDKWMLEYSENGEKRSKELNIKF